MDWGKCTLLICGTAGPINTGLGVGDEGWLVASACEISDGAASGCQTTSKTGKLYQTPKSK